MKRSIVLAIALAVSGILLSLASADSVSRAPTKVISVGHRCRPAGEAISLDLIATTYGRGIVTSNRRDVRVTASIINTTTGETTHIIMANTEGDFH